MRERPHTQTQTTRRTLLLAGATATSTALAGCVWLDQFESTAAGNTPTDADNETIIDVDPPTEDTPPTDDERGEDRPSDDAAPDEGNHTSGNGDDAPPEEDSQPDETDTDAADSSDDTPSDDETPTLHLTTTPGPDAEIGPADAIDVTAEVTDPAGRLDTLVWLEGRNHTEITRDSISGEEISITRRFDDPFWVARGYPTMAYAITEDGRETDLVMSDGPSMRVPIDVEITGTNAPVTGGERLTVHVRAANTGDMQLIGPTQQTIRLIVGHDPQEVDSTTVDLGWNDSTEFDLGYETYPVRQDVEFPVRVEATDSLSATSVVVHGTQRALESQDAADSDSPESAAETVTEDTPPTAAEAGEDRPSDDAAPDEGNHTSGTASDAPPEEDSETSYAECTAALGENATYEDYMACRDDCIPDC